MIVMKFGGSSLKDAGSVKNVAQIIKTKISLQPVIVASAMGKTTRNLLNCCLAAAKHDIQTSNELLKSIKKYHFDIMDGLGIVETDRKTEQIIQSFFNSIQTNLEIIKSQKSLSPQLQDATLAYGELLSTLILSACLDSIDLNVELLDSRDCIVTDAHFTHATPIMPEIYKKIHGYITPILNDNKLIVIQGFIGATQSAETTTLGFEGSDFSAVLIGAALKVHEVQIWKDVPGVMSADPAMIESAVPVEFMTFSEAAELSRCGAKVLHPSTIRPARDLNIPVKIFNSKQPDFKGTTISNTFHQSTNAVKSITCRKELSIVELTAKQLLSEFDFSAHVFVTLRDLEISPEIVEVTDQKVILIINTGALIRSFLDRMSQWADIKIENDKATISVIGQDIRNKPEIVERIENCQLCQFVEYDADKTSDHSYTLILNEENLDSALQELHDKMINYSLKRT
ncbi:MAG: aspartate kinase [Calditrichaceae bacterium]|jgi:aspartate kinase